MICYSYYHLSSKNFSSLIVHGYCNNGIGLVINGNIGINGNWFGLTDCIRQPLSCTENTLLNLHRGSEYRMDSILE